jgi:hypothetical protein
MVFNDHMITLGVGVLAIVVPWQLISMLNLKRNPGVYLHMFKTSSTITGISFLGTFMVINSRNQMSQDLSRKYFQDITDQQLISFHAIF